MGRGTPGTFLTGSPVVAGGVLYAATRDENGDGNAAVHAVDDRSGELTWEHMTKISVDGTIAVSDGVVYAEDLRSNPIGARRGQRRALGQPAPAPQANPL